MLPKGRSAALILTMLALGALSAAAAAEPLAAEQDALLARIINAQRGVATVQGRFTQRTRRANEPEDEGKAYSARFAMRVPDSYNLDYTKPDNDDWRLRLCSDGKKSWQVEQMFKGEKPDVTQRVLTEKIDDSDIFRRITSFFRVDDAALKQDFTLMAEAREGGYRLTLVPLKPAIAEQLKKIVVDLDAAFKTTAITFDDTQGNRIIVTVEEAIYNRSLPDETFVYAGAGK